MKVVALAGGTGSAKLLRGLSKVTSDLIVIGNVGDNVWMHGLYICPDLDIAMYTLAGLQDSKKGWGIKDDTFRTLGQLGRLKEETWFSLGDLDLATHIARTAHIRNGETLTRVTDRLRRAFGVHAGLLPATDYPLETHIVTPTGELHLQEFWVKKHGEPSVRAVNYAGSSEAQPTKEVESAVEAADRIVICPANPVTSIGPILAIRGFRKKLSEVGARVTALSPMVGSRPFAGPAAKLMKAMGMETNSVGVARAYSGFLDSIVMDSSDKEMARRIEGMKIDCRLSDTRMASLPDERRLARELLEA